MCQGEINVNFFPYVYLVILTAFVKNTVPSPLNYTVEDLGYRSVTFFFFVMSFFNLVIGVKLAYKIRWKHSFLFSEKDFVILSVSLP